MSPIPRSLNTFAAPLLLFFLSHQFTISSSVTVSILLLSKSVSIAFKTCTFSSPVILRTIVLLLLGRTSLRSHKSSFHQAIFLRNSSSDAKAPLNFFSYLDRILEIRSCTNLYCSKINHELCSTSAISFVI